jgi:uncharacterized membrane protein
VNDSNLTWRAAGLGAVAGLRSMAAPAALSRTAQRGDLDGLRDTPLALLGSRRVSTLLSLFEVGELIGDKLPVMPSRTSSPPLIGRGASGALVGAALFAAEGRRAATGGVIGAASALTGAYAGERLRVLGTQRLGVPDLPLALVEDAIALFGAYRLLR